MLGRGETYLFLMLAEQNMGMERACVAEVRFNRMHARNTFHGLWKSCSSMRPNGETGGSQVDCCGGGEVLRTSCSVPETFCLR